MKTPAGVWVLSILAFMLGIMYTIWGLRMMHIVTFGPAQSGDGLWLSGLFTLIVGLIWLSVGGALVSLRPWALMFVEIMAIFGLVSAVFTVFATGLTDGLAQAILPGFAFWYANRPHIVEVFTAAEGNR